MSLRPGSQLLSPQPLPPEKPLSTSTAQTSPLLWDKKAKLSAEDGQRPFSHPRWAAEHRLEEKKAWLTNGFDIFECPPPKTENEVCVWGGAGGGSVEGPRGKREGGGRGAPAGWPASAFTHSVAPSVDFEHRLYAEMVMHTGGGEPFIKCTGLGLLSTESLPLLTSWVFWALGVNICSVLPRSRGEAL